ncbi:MAG: hypothetical protein OER43_16100 [Gammaproteobacteria bacterium]|nr:hypothetical protein [Gammaproteobacteria bacterium]MDH3412895.1 hypothetical protein [Gammaproteobacteria bacterium]
MQYLDESFAAFLVDHDLDKLERYAGTVYAVRADFRLAYMNPAWFRFAEENGGEPAISRRWQLGAPVMPAISATLRSFYEIRFRACLQGGEPWMHDYECSSAGVYRRFRQTAYPLKEGSGLLVVNSLSIQAAHDPADRTPRRAAKSSYRDENGVISQCPHCRRVMVPRDSEGWDWVPAWVEGPPQEVEFALCGTCQGRYRADAP